MPRRPDLNHVLVIGSGPILIGQAAEFDYSGTQACRVLKAEGLRVILVNSNPATIMTDPEFADATYVEPITPEVVESIIAKERPDGIVLSPGPGDPRLLDSMVEETRKMVGKVPILGICLGHQVTARALGAGTFKLPFGHRGGNHPVKDLRTGRIAITAQNHGFAVRGEAGRRLQTDFGEAELTHVNLYDGTIEGLRLLDVPAGCVQYHPEAGPGPHDSVGLFDEFLREFEASAA